MGMMILPKDEFQKLYREFIEDYLLTKKGEEHLNLYLSGRAQALSNFNEITNEIKSGNEVTDQILLKFLPYANTQGNRAKDAWIHAAHTVTKDIKEWFEGAKWTKSKDWPYVAQAIYNFVKRSILNPQQLEEACKEFSNYPYSKGFQAGMLSPLLNALRPDQFVIINNKSCTTLNYLTGKKFDTSLVSYYQSNSAVFSLLTELPDILKIEEKPEILNSDLFDMFCHWAYAIKKIFKPEDIKLASPFSNNFKNFEEANWAFDLFQKTLETLNIQDPSDPIFALTNRISPGGNKIHFDYGNWLILGFEGRKDGIQRIFISLPSGEKNFPILEEGKFDQPKNELQISLFRISMTVFKQFEGEIISQYLIALNMIKARFENWKGSPFHKLHKLPFSLAAFQSDLRKQIFSEGIDIIEQEEEEGPIPPNGNPPGEEIESPQSEYSLDQCSEETGLEKQELMKWVKAINRKKQVVLYGPPGTGKTFLAEKLAQHLIGGGNGFYELIQFHPEVSYEDFIQGIRPKSLENGNLSYPIIPGRFLNFCYKAKQKTDRCVLIIDEINRANLSRVFGELMYLLEYRDKDVELIAGNRFNIPNNVFIIGTMNTADRSIALVDHALRRRFAFLPLYPNYGVLRYYHERDKTGFAIEELISVLNDLNKQINDRHYGIGPSYFMRIDLADQIADIWQMEIEPYLEELFFDQPDKLKNFSWEVIEKKIIG